MTDEEKKKREEMMSSMSNVPKDKESLIRELQSAEPEKMNWLMLNFLVQKMYDNVQSNPEWQSERDIQEKQNRYGMSGRGMYRDNSYPMRGYDMRRRMTGVGQMYRGYSPESEQLMEAKQQIAKAIGHSLTDEDIKCLICREAGNLINKICKDESYEAYKEFCELTMAMCAYSENMLPEDLELAAKEEAISKYAAMFTDSNGDRREFRARVMMRDGDYAGRRRMEGRDYRDHRGDVPTVTIADFGRRGRDSMGRYK